MVWFICFISRTTRRGSIFFFQAEDGIRDLYVTGVQTCALPIWHLLGAAGGLEAGITVLAVHNQAAPPTINLDDPDPECDLDYVPNRMRPLAIEYGLSNSFGFGGTNAALLFKRYEDGRA